MDVSLLVGSEIATFCELFTTRVALERLLSSVSSHMDFERAGAHKALTTLLTLEWSLTSMPSVVI